MMVESAPSRPSAPSIAPSPLPRSCEEWYATHLRSSLPPVRGRKASRWGCARGVAALSSSRVSLPPSAWLRRRMRMGWDGDGRWERRRLREGEQRRRGGNKNQLERMLNAVLVLASSLRRQATTAAAMVPLRNRRRRGSDQQKRRSKSSSTRFQFLIPYSHQAVSHPIPLLRIHHWDARGPSCIPRSVGRT